MIIILSFSLIIHLGCSKVPITYVLVDNLKSYLEDCIVLVRHVQFSWGLNILMRPVSSVNWKDERTSLSRANYSDNALLYLQCYTFI